MTSELWDSEERGAQPPEDPPSEARSPVAACSQPGQGPVDDDVGPVEETEHALSSGPRGSDAADAVPTGFAAAVMAVISGVAQVESLSRTLVEGAVRQVLRGVALDTGTSAEELMAAHGDGPVADWTRADRLGGLLRHRRPPPRPRASRAEPPPPLQLCTATTRAKRPCSKPVRPGSTICSWHYGMSETAARAKEPDPLDETAADAAAAKRQRVALFQERLRAMPPPPPRASQAVWTFSQSQPAPLAD